MQGLTSSFSTKYALRNQWFAAKPGGQVLTYIGDGLKEEKNKRTRSNDHARFSAQTVPKLLARADSCHIMEKKAERSPCLSNDLTH